MRFFKRHAQAIAISDYWNKLVESEPTVFTLDERTSARAEEPAVSPGTERVVDPEHARVIAQLYELDDAQMPDPFFLNKLEKTLMESAQSMRLQTAPLQLKEPVISNGNRPAPSGWRPTVTTRRTRMPHRRALISLATAALILLTGVAGYFAWQSGNQSNAPAFVPAQQVTPATDWPMYRGNPGRTGVMPGTGPKSTPSEIWRVQLAGIAFRSPIVVGDTAYVGTGQGTLYALDSATGEEKWQFQGDSGLEITQAYADGVVFVPSQLGTLYAIDAATGEEKWRFAKPLAEFATPTFGDGLLFAASETDSHIYGIDPATGAEVWSYEAGSPVNRGQAYDNGVLYSGSSGGILYALNATDGAELWQLDLQQDGVGTVTVANGIVYAGAPGGVVVLVDAATGAELQRFTTPSTDGISPVTVADDRLYTGGWNASVIAIDLGSGEVAWTSPTANTVRAAVALVDDVVYAVGLDNIVYAFDAAAGTQLWTYTLDGAMDIGPAVANGMIYASTDTGTVIALGESGNGSADLQASPVTNTGVADESIEAVVADTFDESQVTLVWESSGNPDEPLVTPHSMAVGPDGNIWVGGYGPSAFDILAADGTHLESWGVKGSGPGDFNNVESFGFDADGNLYAFDIGDFRIKKFDTDLAFVSEWGSEGTGNGQFQEMHGFVDAANGRIYTADFVSNRIQVFDLDGNFLDKWGSSGSGDGQFRSPTLGMAVDDRGNLFVGDSANGSGGRVQQFDQFGTWMATLAEGGEPPSRFTEVWGLAFDANGNLFVSDYWNNQIQVFDPDFNWVGTISTAGDAGAFLTPVGLYIDAGGFLYVADMGNNRIVKLKLPPLE